MEYQKKEMRMQPTAYRTGKMGQSAGALAGSRTSILFVFLRMVGCGPVVSRTGARFYVLKLSFTLNRAGRTYERSYKRSLKFSVNLTVVVGNYSGKSGEEFSVVSGPGSHDPQKSDTDADGLHDGLELGLDGYDADSDHTTNPLNEDTDGDGLPDGWIDGWGYDDQTNEWGLFNLSSPVQGKKDLCEGEDFNLNGKFDEKPRFIYEGEDVISETIPDTTTDRDDDGVPDGTDTDGDGLQDGLEELGWEVEVYFERNPNLRFEPYSVWSDPLVSDTDNDGLDDMNESLYGGDPWKSDTDGDGIADADENEAGSAVDGIEATAPKLEDGLDLKRGYDRYTKWKWGVPFQRFEVEITVSGVAIDNVGVKRVLLEVESTGAYGREILHPGVDDDPKRYEFEQKFEFTLTLKSLVGDFWSGWDIYVNISDLNGNMADKSDHLNSVIEALVDAVAEAIKKLASMAIEWLKDKAKTLMNKVVSPIKQGLETIMDMVMTPYQQILEAIFFQGATRGATNLDSSLIEDFALQFSILFGLASIVGLGLIAIDVIVNGISFGSAAIVTTIIGVVAPILITALFGAFKDESPTEWVTDGITDIYEWLSNTIGFSIPSEHNTYTVKEKTRSNGGEYCFSTIVPAGLALIANLIILKKGIIPSFNAGEALACFIGAIVINSYLGILTKGLAKSIEGDHPTVSKVINLFCLSIVAFLAGLGIVASLKCKTPLARAILLIASGVEVFFLIWSLFQI